MTFYFVQHFLLSFDLFLYQGERLIDYPGFLFPGTTRIILYGHENDYILTDYRSRVY